MRGGRWRPVRVRAELVRAFEEVVFMDGGHLGVSQVGAVVVYVLRHRGYSSFDGLVPRQLNRTEVRVVIFLQVERWHFPVRELRGGWVFICGSQVQVDLMVVTGDRSLLRLLQIALESEFLLITNRHVCDIADLQFLLRTHDLVWRNWHLQLDHRLHER